MVRVKICGITSWADARDAIEAGADTLGFNFYRRSPRYIPPARARRILKRLPRGVRAVGVFVNEPPARVVRLARELGLDLAQLHGEESPEDVAALARAVPVIKAFRVRPGFRPARLKAYRGATAFLLDGFDPRRRGGTGRTFEWTLARRAKRYGRIYLAGGLRPENVAEAVRAARPYAIDLCSGVEARPGKKDPRRLRELMRAVQALQVRRR
jgi:phosphoribosylanthranilate isomerase